MGLRELFNAIRRAPAPPGGSGKTTTRTGEALDLELYKKDGCPYCQLVYRAIARLGVPVRLRDIERDPGAAQRLVEFGGQDQVPCLFVNGKPMYESADIVAFLEARFA